MQGIDKLKKYRDSLTPEQKAENIVRMQAARVLKTEKIQANKHNVKREYLDSNHWATLASRYAIRMPSNDEAVSVPILRKYIIKSGIGTEKFNEHYTGMTYFVKHNPKWSAYAAAGIILELKETYEESN